jgi:hypothetical protein
MSIDWTADTTWKRVFEPKDAAICDAVEPEETVLPFGGNCLIDVNFDE